MMRAHEGVAAYHEAFDLLASWEAESANAIWQADHCILRIWLLDDHGNVRRSLLTTILDDYSRAVAGYHLGWSAPSALNTAHALHQAILPKSDAQWTIHGVPACFYTDHGSDFTSRHLEIVAAELGMSFLFSTAGRPRGRGKQERFFRTVEQELLSMLPGYCPKVDWPQQRTVDEQTRHKASLTLTEFDMVFRHWVLHMYHVEEHSVTHVPPQTRWLSSHIVPHLPERLSQLDVLLLKREMRTVHQEGIRFANAWYMDALLASCVGEQVVVRYDPTTLSALQVYRISPLQEEQFLCVAQFVQRGGQATDLEEITEARTAQSRQLGKAVRMRQRVAKTYQPEQRMAASLLERERAARGQVEAKQDGEQPMEHSEPLASETSDGELFPFRWYEDE